MILIPHTSLYDDPTKRIIFEIEKSLFNNTNKNMTLNEQLITKLARLNTLETYKRAMLSDYMPIKNEIEALRDDIEDLEFKLMNIDSAENDKRFDDLIESVTGHTILTAEEEEQLLDEKNNPDDYVESDAKDLESSQ